MTSTSLPPRWGGLVLNQGLVHLGSDLPLISWTELEVGIASKT